MVDNLFKFGISFSVLSVLLNGALSPILAMNNPDKDEFPSGQQLTSSTPDIDANLLVPYTSQPAPSSIVVPLPKETKKIYQPTQERGVPDFYETEVTNDEWDHAVAQISAGITSGFVIEVPEVIDKCLQDWTNFSDRFYGMYQQVSRVKKVRDNLDIGKFKENLFFFVVHFENFYTQLKDTYRAQKKDFSSFVNSFKTFQKTWNWAMKFYHERTNEELGFFGNLNFSQSHENYLKHLYYTRDKLGFLLFSIYAHKEVIPRSNIYETYISYGDIDKTLFHERWVYFRTSPNSPTIDLIKNRALIVKKDMGKATSMEPYLGDRGVVPFSKHYGIGAFTDAFHSDGRYREQLLLSQEHTARIMNAVTSYEAIPYGISDELSQSCAFSKMFHDFANRILGDELEKAIFMPETELDHMEANYWFLLDLQSRQAKAPEDLDVKYALEWFDVNFSGRALDEVIKECEKNLEEAYINEEKERLENQIHKEQLERSQMVISGAHNSPKKKSGKGKKSQKQASLSAKSKGNATPSLSKAKITESAKAYARKKIEELKNLKKMKDLKSKSKEIGKTMKYDEYVAMVNVALQGLRNLGANITGGLNESSHGALKVDDTVLPLHRPHGSRHNMVYGSSAREFLNGLLSMYFEKTAQKALTKE